MLKYLIMVYAIETNKGGFEGKSVEEIITNIADDCVSEDWTPDIQGLYLNGEYLSIDISKIQRQVDDKVDNDKKQGFIDHEGKDINYFDQKRLDL